MPGDTLRLFKYESMFLSTFEEKPEKYPKRISRVTVGDDKDDNLFPSKLSEPSETQHLYLYRGERPRRYGYPICWSQTNYEWYPYLPAVVKFDYPIFRGMSRTPEIIHGKKGYGLEENELKKWQNVEYVMLRVNAVVGQDQHVGLEHRMPEPPSAFGYANGHTRPDFAKKSVMKSLNAFQRLLAYLSFTVSRANSLGSLGGDVRFYSDAWVSDLYKKLDVGHADIHIFTKLLLSTLWDIRTSGNFTGVVVRHDQDYDYLDVKRMLHHNVPVYVAWPGPGVNPYKKFYRNHFLQDFIPKPEDFEALERPPTPQPAIAPAPTAETQTIRYGVRPASKPLQTYDHPVEYVNLRLRQIPGQLDKASNRQSMLDRLASSRKLTNLGSASFFRFDSTTVDDEQTGQKERWYRTKLTRHDAKIYFEDAEGCNLWFDHVLNEWNYSEYLNIKENMPSRDPDPLGEAGMDVLESYEADELCLILEEGELADDTNGPPPEEETPEPTFNDNLLQEPSASQFSTDEALTECWTLYANDFLHKRYGLHCLDEPDAHDIDESFVSKLGLTKGRTNHAVAALFNSCENSTPLPRECDLSPRFEGEDGKFPHPPSTSSVTVRPVQRGEGYLLTVNGRVPCTWKLLITDPLTILQIEREEWHLQDDSLVLNLVRKGLPFRILYPSFQRGAVFYPHPGPIVHPDGKYPTCSDFLAYRLDAVDFFKLYPHAHAAALCAGGILWRIAMDSLPLPEEHELLRPFHRLACAEYNIDGERYWSPELSDRDEETVVGVYKWADPKQSVKLDSWWPKHKAWTSSGLDFGAWSPEDERWYQQRKKLLAEGQTSTIRVREWKDSVKFQRAAVIKFLSGIRAAAKEFIKNRHP